MIVLFKDSFWLKKLDRYILLYGIIICFINVNKLFIIIILIVIWKKEKLIIYVRLLLNRIGKFL